MNCQHCQAELTSKRQKQCPDCAEIKNNAHRYGTYGATMEAFDKAKAAGLVGQEMRDFVTGKKAEAVVENHKKADEFRALRADSIARYTARANGRDGYCRQCGGYNFSHDPMCEFGTFA